MAEEKKLEITKEIREQLRKPFPPEAISQHPTKTFLSTLKAIYITERLNDVFGIAKWNLHTEIVKETPDYILLKGKLYIHDYNVNITSQYGGHNTTGKNTEIADGYKSAVTDCLSKCASYLEIGIDIFKGKVKGQQSGYSKPVNNYSKPSYQAPVTPNIPKEARVCSNCMEPISDAEYQFSMKKFTNALCRKCQTQEEANRSV